MEDHFLFVIFLIFSGASVLATAALFTRQSLIVAYIVLGVILGPFGLKWVNDAKLVRQIADVGIIFLLFLLGLNLHPQNLGRMLKSATSVTLISTLIFGLTGFAIAKVFSVSTMEAAIIGIAITFSSTIIGLKLLPTTVLHHQHTGEVVISILLLQDIIAILTLLTLHSVSTGHISFKEVVSVILALPGLIVVCFLVQRYILIKLFQRFDVVQEYIFLMAIGWSLAVSKLGYYLGLSHEMGAFIAGVSLATSPIALFIAESLKPLRDFFLILFFFSLGAMFDVGSLPDVIIPASVLAIVMLLLKPATFWVLLKNTHESSKLALEVGTRLGQISEFSLLVVFIANEVGLLKSYAFNLVQTATLITFIISSYIIVMFYPTPIGVNNKLRQN